MEAGSLAGTTFAVDDDEMLEVLNGGGLALTGVTGDFLFFQIAGPGFICDSCVKNGDVKMCVMPIFVQNIKS